MIDLQSVTLIKGGKKLFEDFDWRIDGGHNWVISGANGSGKTLLLEILSGSVHLAKGKIEYDFIEGSGWDHRHRQKKQKIVYIPTHAIQALLNNDPALYYQQRYYASGDEGGILVRDMLDVDPAVIENLGIPESLSVKSLLNREVTRLSNGQLKKVLLLKSIAHEIPKLLLLDYPFEGLDPESRRDLCLFLDFVHTTHGIQIILSDHHHQLPSVITRRLMLDQFKIKSENAIENTHPALPRLQNLSSKSSTREDSIVELKNVTIGYGDKTIIDSLNWRVEKGDRWALIGRNGAGKTTLFSMIFADHPHAYSQEIFLFGKRRGTGESIWDVKKRISYLGPEVINFLNPKGILISGRAYVSNTNPQMIEGKLEELIRFFDAGFMEFPVQTFSSGQLQLMMIIQCFLRTKELLLLDEPFQFLDPDHTALVRNYLKSHLDSDTTLILITHYEQDISDWTEKTLRL